MPDLDERAARLAATQHGLLTRRQGLRIGLGPDAIRHRIDRGRWVIIERGVYLIHGAPFTWHTRVMAACLTAGGAASHRTCAILHGVGGFRQGTPELTVRRGTRLHSGSARVHESSDLHRAQIVRREGIPTTDLARLVVDLGAVVQFDRYEATVDEIIGRGMLTWDIALDSLLAHSKQGRNGVGPLRALLEERYGDDVSESALQRAFERFLRSTGIEMPIAEFSIYDSAGFIARVDYAYPDHKIAIELDGRQFHLTAHAFEEDPRKRNRLKLEGWLVLEYTWKMVLQQPQMILRQIERAISSRR